MYYQRYTAKRFMRAYHGDHLPETRFKRWYLPVDLPSFVKDGGSGSGSSAGASGGAEKSGGGLFSSLKTAASSSTSAESSTPRLPVSSLMVREIERRLDTAVFRSCFARSIYEARAMVLAGKITLNGAKTKDPGALLNPGDLFTVTDPASIPMLSDELSKKYAEKVAKKQAEIDAAKKSEQAVGEEAQEKADGEAEGAAAETAATKTDGESETTAAAEQANSEASESKQEGEADKAEASPSLSSPPKSSPPSLAPGERAFHLPPFAAPFLFVPPYLEVSFATCSTIYLRHPTLSRRTFTRVDESGKQAKRTEVLSDIPSPYDARGEFFNLAWEHYAKNSPRVRSDLRRLRLEAREGRRGHESARAADEWKRKVAQRRGWLRGTSEYAQRIIAKRRVRGAGGGRARGGVRVRRVYGHKVGHHFLSGK